MQLVTFLKNFIKRGDVSDEWCEKLTEGPCLDVFKIAVTHESANPVNNYEQLEFFGDTILNQAIVWWIKSRHPKIVNLEWLTKIKHLLISTRFVRRIGALLELDKVIVYNKNVFSVASLDSHEFSKMVEDVVEALLGAVCENFINLGFEHGVGVQVCQNIVWSILDEINIPITYESIWDPNVIVKEMFDSQRWIFVWNDAVTENKAEKVISLNWWNEVCANDCTIKPVVKRNQYIDMFLRYHNTNNIYQKFRLDKNFVKTVESLEFDKDIGNANRLPIGVFKKYFGEGQPLVSKRCHADDEKVCKFDLSTQAINIMKQAGYPLANPPSLYSNPRKYNITERPQVQPQPQVFKMQPQAPVFKPQPQVFKPQPQVLKMQPQQHVAVGGGDLLKQHGIKTLTDYFNWEKRNDKNTKLYKDIAMEAQRKGWIGGRY
jgi:hypothetical protein